jgi:hypothetical protein
MKTVETDFGVTEKMLMKLTTPAHVNTKVWLTVPSNGDISVGDVITVKATFEVSRTDAHFAFGKRPHFVSNNTMGGKIV